MVAKKRNTLRGKASARNNQKFGADVVNDGIVDEKYDLESDPRAFLHQPKAVSYTHLDVYKRQLLYGIEHKFLKAQNSSVFDIEHFFNINIMCALHRNKLRNYKDVEIAQRKLQVAWKKVLERKNNTGLANILVSTLGRQVGFKPELAGLEPVQISLPSVPTSITGVELKSFLNRNEGTYLIARTLLDFDQNNAQYPELQEYIRQYQSALGENSDPYDTYLKSLEQLETQPPQETTEKKLE